MGIKRTSVLRIILQNPCLKKCPQYWGHSSWTFSTFVPNIQYICPKRLGHFLTYSFWPLIININAYFLYFLYSNVCCLLTVVCWLSLPFYNFSTSRGRNHYIPEIKVSTSRDKLHPKAWDVCFETWDINLYEERETFISGCSNCYVLM